MAILRSYGFPEPRLSDRPLGYKVTDVYHVSTSIALLPGRRVARWEKERVRVPRRHGTNTQIPSGGRLPSLGVQAGFLVKRFGPMRYFLTVVSPFPRKVHVLLALHHPHPSQDGGLGQALGRRKTPAGATDDERGDFYGRVRSCMAGHLCRARRSALNFAR